MHRLAMHLGGMTVRELRARLTVSELFDWVAFFHPETNEPDADDLDPATIAAAFGIKRKTKNASPEPPTATSGPPHPHQQHRNGQSPVL